MNNRPRDVEKMNLYKKMATMLLTTNLTQLQIAEILGVHHTNLSKFKKRTEFQAIYNNLYEELNSETRLKCKSK